ncbi:MAG TPA: zinc ribbon domain-containing protein [Desulfobacteraceae bacterium]|nr:zinc ribbon domain-containing protein [Desulfobacteraceae bacterium]
MPIYEFKCNQCQNSFETLVLGAETASCPSCQGKDLTKLLSQCGFVSNLSGQDNSGQNAPSSSSFSSSCGSCSAASCSSCTSG